MGAEQAAHTRASTAATPARAAVRPRPETVSILRGGAPEAIQRTAQPVDIAMRDAPSNRVMRETDSHSPSLDEIALENENGETAQRTASGPESDTVQRLTGGLATIGCGVHPWRGRAPVGCNIRAETNGGNAVTGWTPDSTVAANSQFWCHGHSLGTFTAHNYSIYSGPDMDQAVTDEHTRLATGVSPRTGDIAVWEPGYDHSAIFNNVVEVGSGVIDESATTLSTKNGMQALTTKTMAQLRVDYPGGTPGWFR